MIYFLKLRDNIQQLFNLNKTKFYHQNFLNVNTTQLTILFLFFFLKLHLIKLIFYKDIKLKDS